MQDTRETQARHALESMGYELVAHRGRFDYRGEWQPPSYEILDRRPLPPLVTGIGDLDEVEGWIKVHSDQD